MFRRLAHWKVPAAACAAFVVFVSLHACSNGVTIIGDSMGTFRFHAVPYAFDGGPARACEDTPELPTSPDGFDFEGTFSRLRDAPDAFFVINGITRTGTILGQVVTTGVDAGRRFEVTDCVNQFNAEETLTVALISESQTHYYAGLPPPEGSNESQSQGCPYLGTFPSLLSSGDFQVDPDAGIVAPSFSVEGFDAIHSCGFLTDVISPQGDCPAYHQYKDPDSGMIVETEPSVCTATWYVEGVRKQ